MVAEKKKYATLNMDIKYEEVQKIVDHIDVLINGYEDMVNGVGREPQFVNIPCVKHDLQDVKYKLWELKWEKV